MRNRRCKQAEIVARGARAAAALICAYAIALTTVLSSWNALALTLPAGSDGAVICLAHPDGAGGKAPAPHHHHHRLCGQICSMAGCSADLVLTVNTAFTPIATSLLPGRLAGGYQGDAAPAVFLSDHRVRGPPAA